MKQIGIFDSDTGKFICTYPVSCGLEPRYRVFIRPLTSLEKFKIFHKGIN